MLGLADIWKFFIFKLHTMHSRVVEKNSYLYLKDFYGKHIFVLGTIFNELRLILFGIPTKIY